MRLDAPDGFDFTDNCSVGQLAPLYYQDWQGLPWGETVLGPNALTSSLGLDVNCSTDNWKRSVLEPPATQARELEVETKQYEADVKYQAYLDVFKCV